MPQRYKLGTTYNFIVLYNYLEKHSDGHYIPHSIHKYDSEMSHYWVILFYKIHKRFYGK